MPQAQESELMGRGSVSEFPRFVAGSQGTIKYVRAVKKVVGRCVGRGKVDDDGTWAGRLHIAGTKRRGAARGWADATKPGGEGRDTEITPYTFSI